MQIKRRFTCPPNYVNVAALLVCTVLLCTIVSLRTNGLFPAAERVVKRILRQQLARSRPPDWLKGSSSIDVEPTGFVVDTPSCRIPDFDAFNPIISPYVRDPDPRFTVCNHSQPVTFTDRQYIRLNTTLADSLGVQHCVYQQVGP